MAIYEAEIHAEVAYVVNISAKTKAEAERRAREAFEEETCVHVVQMKGVSLRQFGAPERETK